MKILYVIDGLTGGGAEKLVHDLLPRINEVHPSELLILTLVNQKYYDSLIEQGIKITVVPNNGKSILKTIWFIRNFIQRGKFDIVHVHLFPVLYYCAFVKRFFLPKQRLIFTEHCTDNRRMHLPVIRPLEKYVYSQYDHVISISNETQEKLMEWLQPTDEKKFSVVENGIPLEPMYHAAACKVETLIGKTESDDVVMCMIGRLETQKNHDFIIDVMDELPDKYKLLILGEGILEKEIREKTRRLHVDDRVFFLGFQKNVASIIKASAMVVVPSRWEGFGLVAVEAMACGKPVVCTDVPGLAGVVADAGIKVPLGDVRGFANAIQKIADMSENEKYEMQRKARNRAKVYDINRMLTGYMEVYDELIMNG